MISINMEKEINVNRIICLLELKVKEKRPDITWLLGNLGQWGLSKGEEKNLIRYLEYLNLVKSYNLTAVGQDALDSGFVMVPEAGVYELLYIQDKVLGNVAIDFNRINPKNDLEGNREEFTGYETFDEKIFEVFKKNKNDQFWLRFEKPINGPSGPPTVIVNNPIKGSLKVRFGLDKPPEIEFNCSNGRTQNYRRKQFDDFNPKKNLSKWFKNWDSNNNSLSLTFDEVKDNPGILNSFRSSIKLIGQSLFLGRDKDDGDWKVNIVVPVLPKTEADARKWLNNLLIEKIVERSGYISISEIERMEQEIINSTPIENKFPKIKASGNDFFEEMKKDNQLLDISRMVQAVEDLSPKVGLLEGI